MYDQPSVAISLAEVGYRRLKRHVYRAEWSTEDVEHFIYFYPYPKGYYLAVRFGLRNKEADFFAMRSTKAYGGPLGGFFRYDERSDCFLQPSLGELAGSWGLGSALAVPEMSGPALAHTVKQSIEQKLLPLIRNVLTLDSLLALLLTDAEPWPWIRSNGALRVAQIMSLAARLRMDPHIVRASLPISYKSSMKSELHNAPNPDPDAYIDRVIEDAYRQPA